MIRLAPIPVRLTVCLALLAPLGLDGAAAAQPPAGKAARAEGDPELRRKVAGPLLAARQRMRAKQPLNRGPRLPGSNLQALPLVRERTPQVDIVVRGLTPATVETLKSIGVEVIKVHWRYGRIDARVDLDQLDELAAVPEVEMVRPDYGRIKTTGTVTSQGDASTHSDDVRTTGSGADGTGVTVGILSDSFNFSRGGTESGGACDCSTPGSTCANVVTGMTNQNSNDLPPSIPILADFSPGGDEGAAMGEIVYDLAPGAAQMFHTAFVSEMDFASGIIELANCGAGVIVDDVFYLGEPMFQDGLIAQAAQEVVDGGVIYHSSAGNQATFGVDEDFLDVTPGTDNLTVAPPSGDDFHDFGGGDTFAKVIIPPSTNPGCPADPFKCCGVTAILQWSEPFDSLDDTDTLGALSDLDIYGCGSESAAACTIDENGFQGCGTAAGVFGTAAGDPIELLTVINTSDSLSAAGFLAVDSYCDDGTANLPQFRIATFPFNAGSCSPASGFPGGFRFEDGDMDMGFGADPEDRIPTFVDAQIHGHAAAKGAVAVAATFWDEFDSNGTQQNPPSVIDVEPFSSMGGAIPIYFTGSGAPLGPAAAGPEALAGGPPPLAPPPAPETRQKPEITGPDGTANTFFGGGSFFGTSAAAPHTAAIAALLEELAPNLSPAGSRAVLQGGAVDIETPGFDDLSGAGYVDAERSASVLDPALSALVANLLLDLDGGGWVDNPAGTNVPAKATSSITYGNGDFSGIDAVAPQHIFTDGFESGDLASWSNSTP